MDEREHMENLFDCLCAALMFTANRQRFLDGEGLQLMNLMLRFVRGVEGFDLNMDLGRNKMFFYCLFLLLV